MLDLLASTRPTSKSDRLSWRVKSKLDARCWTNDRPIASIDLFTGCEIKNRRARRDRVRHPPPMPNCTNWLASCQAMLHRIQGCPVHATSSLLASISTQRASVHRASKAYRGRQNPNSERVKLSTQGCPECAITNFNSQQFLWHSCKNHKNHKLIIFTPL